MRTHLEPRGVCAAIVRTYEEAEGRALAATAPVTMVQETLLAVWRMADKFEPNATTPSVWIYTISRNLNSDQYRHERRRGDARIEVADDPQS